MYKIKYHDVDLSHFSILVTGGAGFIGSHLVEYLVKNNVGRLKILDNLSTGYILNIEKYLNLPNVEFIKGDIRNLEVCQLACNGVDYVLHQAALGSVPRSITDPIQTNQVNIDGFLNMLVAVRDQKVRRMVYAASSSTYGDSTELPKVEERIGKPLSPYAITKYVNELYAEIFANTYGIEVVGLRYFNIFGPRQAVDGAYAAVIPLFMKATIDGASPIINGDGETTRDFTFVENAVQANIKAMFTSNVESINTVYNVACEERTSLNQLLQIIGSLEGKDIIPIYRETRRGDIKDSLADITKIRTHLSYEPIFKLRDGLKITYKYFKELK